MFSVSSPSSTARPRIQKTSPFDIVVVVVLFSALLIWFLIPVLRHVFKKLSRRRRRRSHGQVGQDAGNFYTPLTTSESEDAEEAFSAVEAEDDDFWNNNLDIRRAATSGHQKDVAVSKRTTVSSPIPASQRRCRLLLREGDFVRALRGYARNFARFSAECLEFRPLFFALLSEESREAVAVEFQNEDWIPGGRRGPVYSGYAAEEVLGKYSTCGGGVERRGWSSRASQPGFLCWRIGVVLSEEDPRNLYGVQDLRRGWRRLCSRLVSAYGVPSLRSLADAVFLLLAHDARNWRLPGLASTFGTFWRVDRIKHGSDIVLAADDAQHPSTGVYGVVTIPWASKQLARHYPALTYLFQLLTLKIRIGVADGDLPLYTLTPDKGARIQFPRPWCESPISGRKWTWPDCTLELRLGVFFSLTFEFSFSFEWTADEGTIIMQLSSQGPQRIGGGLGPILRRAFGVGRVEERLVLSTRTGILNEGEREEGSAGKSSGVLALDVDFDMWVSNIVVRVLRTFSGDDWLDRRVTVLGSLFRLYEIVLDGLADDISSEVVM